MPTINLPNTPYADGVAASGPNVTQDFYDPADSSGTTETFEVINGWLEDVNVLDNGGTRDITVDMIQSRAFSLAGQVGNSVNTDYFHDFVSFDVAAPVESEFIPVTGSNITFRVPYQCRAVIVTWNIGFGSDADAASEQSELRLRLDGVPATGAGHFRRLTRSVEGTQRNGILKERFWSGHTVLVNLPQGWHTVGLYLSHDATQTRVRTRGIRYIAIR